jgi:hypothetical protein
MAQLSITEILPSSSRTWFFFAIAENTTGQPTLYYLFNLAESGLNDDLGMSMTC